MTAEPREHLVFVSHSSLAVGVERSMVALVRAAVDRGSDVTVVLPGSGPIEELLAPWRAAVTIRYRKPQWWMGDDHHGLVAVLKLGHALAQSLPWSRFLRGLRPTTLFIMSSVCPAPLAGGRLAGLPTVAFLSESVRDNPTLRSVIPKSWVVALVHRWASLTVAVSQFAVTQWRGADLVEAPEVDPLPGGLGDGPITDLAPRGGLALVMLGTLSPEKGQADAVDALGLLAADGVSAHLDLYGDADAAGLAALDERARRANVGDRVRHHGRTARPADVLARADLSLVCSRNETYGRVTAESILAGTPVIGYARAGTSEILADGGGVLVDAAPAALADALAALSRDPHRMSALRDETAARARTRAGFGDAARTLSAVDAALRAARESSATSRSRRRTRRL